jgi:hypothetical protein
MKIAKRILIALLILVVLLVGAAVAIPYFFKDEIVAMAREEANKSVNAEVDFADVQLSLLRSFPDFSLQLDSFSVIGKDQFAGIPLVKGEYASFTLDLMSVLRSSEPVAIKSVHLEKPMLEIYVTENGTANYDITLPSEAPAEEPTAEADYSGLVIQLQEYSISGGHLLYDDRSIDVMVDIDGLDHAGSGNFTIDIYDLDTETTIESITVEQGGIAYLKHAKAQLDAIFNIDSPNNKYSLKDNALTVNDLQVNTDGFVQLEGDDVNMELAFNSPQNDFKSLLSLIPNAYIEGYEDVKADGSFTLEGNVSGTYRSEPEEYPGFQINTTVSGANVQYPDLPLGINDINAQASVNSPSSDFNDIIVDIARFSMNLGGNPFTASFNLRTPISDPDMKAVAQGKIDLAQLSQAFPMEGIETLSGLINADLSIDTRLSTIEQERYEDVNMAGALQVQNINYASADMPPVVIQDAQMSFSPKYVEVGNFVAQLGKSDIQAQGRVDNLLAYFSPEKTMTGQMTVRSNYFNVDEWMPETSTTASPAVTAGESEAEAASETEIFDRFDFALDAEAKEIVYAPYTVKNGVTRGHIKPNRLQVDAMSAEIGSSDFSGNGVITGMFDYLFEGGTLGGNLTFTSRNLDLNEFMPETEETTAEATTAEGEAAAYSVIPVPPNIKMDMVANVGRLVYTNIILENLKGHMVVAEEAIILADVTAKGLGGQLGMSGSYDTSVPEEPNFTFKYDLSSLDFQQAFTTFNTFEQFAPIGKYIKGRFNSTLLMEGQLGQDLYPKLNSLTVEGFLQTLDAVIQNFKPAQAIGEKLNIQELKQSININNTKNWFSIEDGKLKLEEYDAKVSDINMRIGGFYSLTEFLNLDIKAKVPRKLLEENQIGAAASAALGNLQKQASQLGFNFAQGEYVDVLINLKGAITDPKVGLKLLGMSGENGESVTDAAKDQAKAAVEEQVESAKKEAEKQAQAAIDSAKAAAQAKANQAAEDLKNKAKEKVGEAIDSTAKEKVDEVLDNVGDKTKEEIKNKIEKFNPFKKKKKDGQ